MSIPALENASLLILQTNFEKHLPVPTLIFPTTPPQTLWTTHIPAKALQNRTSNE